MRALDIYKKLAVNVAGLRFSSPVTHVYNPLDYAWAPFSAYLRRYGEGTRRVLLVGMNPGPFGMAQTGVPFGDVGLVRDWLGIEAPVAKPALEHPKRPVTGFACPRGEVSGQRLWGWARDRYGTPEAFFAQFLVLNYCPLAFMNISGANITPDKLAAAERAPLQALCDAALRAIVAHYEPEHVLGIGGFAEARVIAATAGLTVKTGRLPHPSPASPAANRGWSQLADRAIEDLAIR